MTKEEVTGAFTRLLKYERSGTPDHAHALRYEIEAEKMIDNKRIADALEAIVDRIDDHFAESD